MVKFQRFYWTELQFGLEIFCSEISPGNLVKLLGTKVSTVYFVSSTITIICTIKILEAAGNFAFINMKATRARKTIVNSFFL